MSAPRASSFDVGPNTSDARVEGAYVTHGLFAVLGVAPILGRGLQAGDDDAGSGPVVVLSETFWRQRFGADATILGRTSDIDGVPHSVVGVVPDFLAVGVPGVIRRARIHSGASGSSAFGSPFLVLPRSYLRESASMACCLISFRSVGERLEYA